MEHRKGFFIVSGLVGVSAAIALALSCSDQAPARCGSGRGPYAAKYIYQSGADAGACAIAGESVFLQLYNPPPSDLSPATVAIEGSNMGNAVAQSAPDPDTTHTQFSLGRFATALPGGDNFCDLPALSEAVQNVPEKPPIPPPDDAGPDAEGTPGIPATTIRYAWKNVRLYVTPALPGTQLVGDLTYTVDDCSAQYHVQAVYPSVSCGVQVDDAGTMGPDPSLCDPNADPSQGRAVGSGLGPDLKVVCDPVLLLCVLAGDPPSVR